MDNTKIMSVISLIQLKKYFSTSVILQYKFLFSLERTVLNYKKQIKGLNYSNKILV